MTAAGWSIVRWLHVIQLAALVLSCSTSANDGFKASWTEVSASKLADGVSSLKLKVSAPTWWTAPRAVTLTLDLDMTLASGQEITLGPGETLELSILAGRRAGRAYVSARAGDATAITEPLDLTPVSISACTYITANRVAVPADGITPARVRVGVASATGKPSWGQFIQLCVDPGSEPTPVAVLPAVASLTEGDEVVFEVVGYPTTSKSPPTAVLRPSLSTVSCSPNTGLSLTVAVTPLP